MADLNDDQEGRPDSPLSTAQDMILLHEPLEVFFRRVAAALENQNKLDQQHSSVLSCFKHHLPASKLLGLGSGQYTTASAGIREFLEDCMSAIPVTRRSTANSASKAEDVFGTPELAEAIFLYLRPSEVLSAVQINRATSGAIESSPRIRRLLHLRAGASNNICTLFDGSDPGIYGLHVSLRTPYSPARVARNHPEDVTYPTKMMASVSFHPMEDENGRTVSLPVIGNLCRQMLVCQPPIKTMFFWPECCTTYNVFYRYGWSGERTQNLSDEYESINCETGITVGQIYDKTVETLNKHRYCYNASPCKHDVDGLVNPRVVFGCEIDIDQDDPLRRQEVDEYVSRCKHNAELQDYIKAKKTGMVNTSSRELMLPLTDRIAHENNQPIPSLARFRDDRDQNTS